VPVNETPRGGGESTAPVLVVSTTWPPMAAGAGRALAACIGGLDDVEVVAPVGSTAELVGGAVRVRPLLRFARHAGGPMRMLTLLHHLEAVMAPILWMARMRRRPPVVICSVCLFVGVGGWLASRLFGVPYVVYAQGEELSGPLSRSASNWRRRLTGGVLTRATHVIAISRFAWDLVVRDYGVPERRVSLIAPAVDASEVAGVTLERARRLREGVPSGALLLIVGRLSQSRKGFDRTIEALPIVRRTYPDVVLAVVGPGDAGPLREIARAVGTEDAIRFVGEVDRAELLAWYEAADVFVMPTRIVADGDSEGFGIVYLEANLFGKPVIGGDNAGVRDAVVHGETGLLVDGDDPEAIAGAIARLVGDPEFARRLGSTGRERVLREFSGERQRRAFADVVASVTEARAER
jgi:phosphatidylinositol alpha-1,6-mannosyltransferase